MAWISVNIILLYVDTIPEMQRQFSEIVRWSKGMDKLFYVDVITPWNNTSDNLW